MSETNTRAPVAGGRDGASRRDARRLRRQQQLEARQRLEAAERRKRRLIWAGGIAVAVLALAGLVYWLVSPQPGPPVQSFPIQGRAHIGRGQEHPPYNSTPPTSGWHFADAVAPPGIHTEPIPNEVQVHNLEHGEVMIQYDCPSGCPEMVSQLEAIVRSYPSKVLLAPYPGIGRPIALTSWGKLAYLDDVNEPFIRRFIAQNKDKAPEFFPD
ncbi:MAG: DUF3105 domain-containing protein [Chloroflexota bacterium]